jgi:hypothetical protein
MKSNEMYVMGKKVGQKVGKKGIFESVIKRETI